MAAAYNQNIGNCKYGFCKKTNFLDGLVAGSRFAIKTVGEPGRRCYPQSNETNRRQLHAA